MVVRAVTQSQQEPDPAILYSRGDAQYLFKQRPWFKSWHEPYSLLHTHTHTLEDLDGWLQCTDIHTHIYIIIILLEP